MANKSHSVTAAIVVPQGGVEGVIIAQGADIGGWSLYAKGGKLKIDTGSRNVTGGALTFTATDVETGSGSIELDAVTGPNVDLETSSGDVEVRLTQNPERLDVSTGAGSVLVRMPETVSATIDLDTGSGEFEVNFPLQLVRKGENSLTGRIGDGKGRISIETGSGDITISKYPNSVHGIFLLVRNLLL